MIRAECTDNTTDDYDFITARYNKRYLGITFYTGQLSILDNFLYWTTFYTGQLSILDNFL